MLSQVFTEHPLCASYDDCITHALFPEMEFNLTNHSSLLTNMSSGDESDHVSPKPNTALFSMTLTLFTFVVAYALKGLRNKKLLGRTVSTFTHLSPACHNP